MTETKETFTEAVERLKTNEDHIILADMDDVDRETLGKVGWSNCQILTDNSESLYWGDLSGQDGYFYISHIYRIHPNYQPGPPKPEIINREVYVNKQGDLIVVCPDDAERFIEEVTHRENFRGFHDITGPMCVTDVAEKLSKGFTVVARFERK